VKEKFGSKFEFWYITRKKAEKLWAMGFLMSQVGINEQKSTT
jgi:hypothetical protein